jgi:FKBP-type peptidyl-prolyl cis-trans isomerase FkpA
MTIKGAGLDSGSRKGKRPALHLGGMFLAFSLAGSGALAGAPPAETLPSGVIITHLREGSGPPPSSRDTVRVHYRGTLTNGKEFDSSYGRSPVSFALNEVISCWTQGLRRMRPGGKAKLFCPSKSAYGARGIPGVIPPNSVLIFEVELLAIE